MAKKLRMCADGWPSLAKIKEAAAKQGVTITKCDMTFGIDKEPLYYFTNCMGARYRKYELAKRFIPECDE